MINDLLDRLSELDIALLVVVAFLLPFGETVALLDFVVSGEVGMVFVGAAAETPERALMVFAAGALGAFCGDSVSWYIGHRWGVAVLQRWPWIWSRTERHLQRAESFFDQHGGRAIFTARFIGALRALAPVVAGAANMPYRRFAPWNALASVAWVGLVVTLGAVFGRSIANAVDRAGVALSVITVVAIVAWLVVRKRRQAG
ncbi:MAG: DedA family protein [Actinomycetota bacterium]|nr:DedA family protein [Actinomycetota bacterium]